MQRTIQSNKITSLVFFLLLSFDIYAAKINSLLDAVQVSNHQTSLSYQLLKNYAQLGQDVGFMEATDSLSRIPKQLKDNIASLKAFDSASSGQLTKMTEQLTAAEAILSEEPSLAQAQNLHKIIKSLAESSQNITNSLVDKDLDQTLMVNTAGKQSLLANQLSSYYLLISWGSAEEIIPLYENKLIDFEENLDDLVNATINTAKIIKLVATVNKKWRQFQRSDKLLNGTPTSTTAVRSMDKITQLTDSITVLYTEI